MNERAPNPTVESTSYEHTLALELRTLGCDVDFDDWHGLTGEQVRQLIIKMQGVDIGQEWIKAIDKEREERQYEI